jgi:hypothetical protein
MEDPFAHQFDNLQPYTQEEVDHNLQVVNEILASGKAYESAYESTDDSTDEIVSIYTLRSDIEYLNKKLDSLRIDLEPLIALARAIPDAMDSNPMMKILLGKFSSK